MSVPRGEVVNTLTLHQEIITPEIAAQMLKHGNPNNRPVSKATIDAYANDLSNDDWDSCSINPIVFDENGICRDGHQRLNAIILAGVPMIAWVAEDAPDSNKYDLGRPRSINNILHMNGLEVSSSATALIRSIGVCCFSTAKVSIGEIERAYRTDGETICRIALLAKSYAKTSVLNPAPCAAALYCALKVGILEDTIKEFVEVVNTGIPNNSAWKQTPAFVLRNQLLNMNKSSSRGQKKDRFMITQEALADYVSRKKRVREYTGKGAVYSTIFVDKFRSGKLFGDWL